MDLLDVVMFVQRLHQLEHLLCCLLFQLDRVLRDESNFGKSDADLGVKQSLLDCFEIVRVGDNFETLPSGFDILGTGVQGDGQQRNVIN